MLLTLERNWWAVLVRGIAGIVFAVLAFARPAMGLVTLVVTYGLFAIADGVFGLVSAVNAGRAGRRWGSLVAGGVLSLAAGAVALIWPAITWMVLLSLIAVWAVLRGACEIGAAIALRKQIKNEWLLALNGALAIAFGVLLFARPVAGALAIVYLIAGFALVSGAALIGLSFRLRSLSHAGRVELGGRAAI